VEEGEAEVEVGDVVVLLQPLLLSKAKVKEGISTWTWNRREPSYAPYSVLITQCNAVSLNN